MSTRRRRTLRRWILPIVAATLLAGIVLLCVGADLWVALGWLSSATQNDLLMRNLPPGTTVNGDFHLLGTDPLGRDVLTRMAYGGRVSLFIGACTVVVAGVVGTVLGIIAGYRKGAFDEVIMRLVDLQLAFPGTLLALFIIYITGPGFGNLVLVLSIASWPVIGRLTRSVALSMRERQFIAAARVGGARGGRIMFSEILPNVISPVLALLTIEFSAVMIAEAGLSFIGFGIQPPDTSWGLMLADGREYMTTAWWLVVAPGLAIALTALVANLLTNTVREVLDPQQRRRNGRRKANREQLELQTLRKEDI